KDIAPGPAIIGIASGVNEISERCCASDVTFLLTPRCFPVAPINNPYADIQIINPPAILNTSIEIPKKFKIYFPAKKESIRIINTFMDVHKAVLFLLRLLSFCVKLRKIGTEPIGFITENKAPKVNTNKSITADLFLCEIRKCNSVDKVLLPLMFAI